MTLRAITLRVMEARGQDAADIGLVRITISRMRMALLRQQRKGLIRSTQEAGAAALWRIVE